MEVKMNLKNLCEELGVSVDDNMLAKFDLYYNNLITWNEKFNLTAITERADVDIKHFADSVSGAKYIPQGAKIADVGSGAGFPAIPLKIVRNDISITMMDALNKRVNFLLDTLSVLELDGEAIHVRAEDAARGIYREKYDVVTARAVASTDTLVEYLLPLVKVGGKALLYKGGDVDEELAQAKGIISSLGGKIVKVDKFSFAGQSRALILIDKVAPTPKAYPRRKVGKKK